MRCRVKHEADMSERAGSIAYALAIDMDVPPSQIDESFLETVCEGASVFASRDWVRFLLSLDLWEEYGGSVELRFATATLNGRPLALCPMLRAKGDGVGYIHNLRSLYFEGFFDIAKTASSSEQMPNIERQYLTASYFGKLLRLIGSQLDSVVAIMNPLSARLTVSVSASSPIPRQQVILALFKAMCQREKNRILWFQFVQEGSDEEGALKQLGLPCGFQLYDNWFDLTAIHDMDEYMRSLRRKDRSDVRRDTKKLHDAGVSYQRTEVQPALAESLSHLHHLTASKYGGNTFQRTPRFYENVSKYLGSRTRLSVARHGETIIGYSLTLHCPVERTLWGLDVGRLYDPPYNRLPIYFELAYYTPIRHAIELGCRYLWWGPASYEPKSIRGAKQCPLNGYFHMPRIGDRVLLVPYLRYVGQCMARLIGASVRRPLRVEAPATFLAPAGCDSS